MHLVVELDGDFLVVFLAPLSPVLTISHHFAHVVHRVRHLLILEGHLVQFAKVLLDLVLAQELRGSEPHLVRIHGFGRPSQHHLVTDKFDAFTRLFETRRDRGFDTLRAQVLLELNTFLVVVMELEEILLVALGGCLEVSQLLGVQVADFHWVAHLKVELLGVEAKPLHFH